MKNIVFMTFILISFIYADTVGIAQKMWTSVPKDIYNETEPLATIEESSSSQVSSWSQPTSTRTPVVFNQTKTLDDIKVLTAEATQLKETQAVITQQTNIKAKELTASEKNWITAIETNVAEDTKVAETITTPIVSKAPEKDWITVPDENPTQQTEDLPLAKTETTIATTNQVSTDDTGWIAASQNYNETAFSTSKSRQEQIPLSKEEPVVMASTTIEKPKEEVSSEPASSTITTEASSQIQPEQVIEEEIIKIPEDSGSAEILDSPFDLQKYFQNFSSFISPLTAFIKENAILSGSFLSVLGLFFYLLFYRPLSTRVHNKLDDEIEVPQARMQTQTQYYQQPQQTQKSSFAQEQEMMNSSIITQGEYSTLYGLMNETFIFEKERILLSNDITQERKNREIISLEWKFNQILHFSLPKLSTDSPKLFVEGVKELLDEEVSKDIMIIALKDILEKNTLSSLQKEDLAKHIDRVTPKKASQRETHINNQAQNQELNYSSYMSQ